MLKRLSNALLSASITLLSTIFVRCSSPVSGIETGNPAMTACAKTALNLLSNNSEWQPESYLVNGKEQLNPNSIIKSNQPQSLAKRTAPSDSTSNDSMKPTIVTRIDTIINVSKIFVNDTITRTYTKTDTSHILDKSDNFSDSTTVITEKTVSELIFVVDTVTVYDTFTITHYDTITRWGETATPGNSTSGSKVTISQPASTVTAESDDISVYLSVVTQSKRYSLPADYTSSTNEVYSRISRSGSIAAMSLFEEYLDADGDGSLLSSAGSGIPLVNLAATYALSNQKQTLSVQFDPGADRSFSNTGDNRIHSLHKVKISGEVTNENITYTQVQPTSGEENYSLVLVRTPQNDSVALETTEFSLLVPDSASGTNHNSNKLVKAHYSAQYQNRSVKSMDLNVIPDSKIDATSAPSKASLKAFVDYGKGSTGIFAGNIDYISKTVIGIYSENGTEFEFNYDGTTGESDFEILK